MKSNPVSEEFGSKIVEQHFLETKTVRYSSMIEHYIQTDGTRIDKQKQKIY